MDVMDYSCELSNYCIFQGVGDVFRCDDVGSPCSADAYNSRLDGTFICNYHLGKYFKILKSSFTIPSGIDNRKSFKMLVGQSLIPQQSTDRILIPLNHEAGLNTSTRSAMEKYIIYTIYNDQEASKELCRTLIQQEYYEQPMWLKYEFAINTIMGMISPSALCERVLPVNETRTFLDQTSYEKFNDKPFLKNLINRLVRPIVMSIGGYTIKIQDNNTCTFNNSGLIVPPLHNPNHPVRLDNPRIQPKFSIRTVLEFDGRATLEQRVLDSYDEVILSRPLLNGSQTNT
ncbi:VP39 capsid [Choristoneura occidentalis granulovirus]|uniref:VP39 capsid n=1 Tax=Choristoneura occidentalis granulovirus TaxID=364745 RepID=Q1A4M0_9BBAC|nr:VP39 capsid [Choristoneura fumiferana granulovirus]ABC61210.1 VP39 capsid [Choristoneura fumiferana granulovirus]